jgi:hypothetical protein
MGTGILFCFVLTLYGWQQVSSGPVRPSFAGTWQLDASKSQTEMKDLLWKIEQKETEISIEETSAGKSLSLAKCPIGKSCEFEDSGKKMGAMTYFLDTALVQTRSTADNSSVIKRKITLTGEGALRVELTTIVPSDKTEVLVFTKQAAAAAAKTPK